MLFALGNLADSLIRSLMVVAGYLTNSSTFPQPLSEPEEADCLRRLREGDEEARSILIERNLRLVAHIVNTSWAELQMNEPAARAGSFRVGQWIQGQQMDLLLLPPASLFRTIL